MTRQTPRQALAENKSLLKWRPPLDRWRPWRSALAALLDQVKESETEEFHKTLVRDYLTVALRGEGDKTCPYFINVKNYAQGGGDLVVHGGKTAESSVAAILELKRPGDRVAETPKPDRLNSKALRQLVFYFLQERLQGGNLELKRLVISNLYEWFIFDAAQFERLFVERLEKRFLDFQSGRLTGRTTDYFYENIAQPAIAEVEDQLKFVYVDLRDYESIIREETDEQALTDLFKVFAPEYWLKLPSANDSNRLDEGFYSELLHLMGLTVVKSKGKKLIQRLGEKERLPGSLLENAISQIQSLDKLASLEDPLSYGDTEEEQLFGAALALVIVWVNRVLFLKLLEAQLLSYHREERDLYRFLNGDQIRDYGALQQLFFEVLAAPVAERSSAAQGKFPRVPYLNSSLFEMTDLERRTIVISNLQNEELPVFKGTVLLDDGGKPRTGSMSALAYLFAFLNAYDFGSGETGLLKQDQKRLINSSVLGLIFERINGYKDGSFFTPAFITMYMCRETLRRAVLQKFREVKGWECADLTELYNRIDDKREANEIVNSLKICDPAVGSGHFLVSALNEMIAIKSELGILLDCSGKVLKDYHIAVVDDELAITDEEGRFFEYRPGGRESQRVQEALFHEKQTIIEGCLFGVDINENSVKICQLRLWIELLKNAYYRADGQLETLPNIDINIKRGNSLISRFSLDSDLTGALRKAGSDVARFRGAVRQYHHALSRAERRELLGLMARIKEGFRTTLFGTDPNKARLRQLEGELFSLQNQTVLFAESKAEARAREKKATKLQNEIDKLRAAIEEVESGRLYENALEWRFEFPEVLTDEGDFVGFDVMIGNPPYLPSRLMNEFQKRLYENSYTTSEYQINTFGIFCELGINITKNDNLLCYIIPNYWLSNKNDQKLREFLFKQNTTISIINTYNVFEDATVDTLLLFAQKRKSDGENRISVLSIDSSISTIEKRLAAISHLQWLYNQNIKLSDLDQSLCISFKDQIKIQATHIIGDFFELKFGVKLYQVGKGKPPQTQYHSKNKVYESETLQSNNFFVLLKARNVQRFYLKKDKFYVDYGEHLAEPRNIELFQGDRILLQRIVSRSTLDIAFVTETMICNTDIITLKPVSEKVNIKFYLAILASKLCGFILRSNNINLDRNAFPKINTKTLSTFPVPLYQPQNIQIVNLVDQILDVKKADPKADTSALEAEIDRLVYELYGLTDEEISIIENSQ